MKTNHYTMKLRKLIIDALKQASVDGNDPIGVGVSGGADSTALLFGLSRIYHGDRAKLVHVISVDHGLQEVTAKVSESVMQLAETFGFTAETIRVDIQETSNGLEDDARRARYSAFDSAIEKYDLSAFLIGHTMNDQAEQVFLGLLRGSGTKSLSAMKIQRDLFLRPMLYAMTRQETEFVCDENDYAYWNDPHNEDAKKFRRVAIRKMVSAVEESTGNSIVEPLVKSSKIAAEDDEALDFFTAKAVEEFNSANWSVEALSSYPASIRKRAYREELISRGAKSDRISFELTNRIDALITDWHGQAEVQLAGGFRAKRESGFIVFFEI